MGSTTAADTFTVPAWLNTELLSQVLSKETNRDVSVTDFDAKAAVPKGDNYLSTLYRIVAQCKGTGEEKDSNKYFLIVKTLPAGELIQQFLSGMRGFEKELCIYTEVFPAIYRIMKSATGRIRPLSARCLPCERENTIILEDLQHLGYTMANRHKGLDLDHCKVTVRAQARLHAYSVALYKTNPSFVETFREGFYVSEVDKREMMQRHFEININTLASKIEKWSGYEHYAEKVRKLIPTALDLMIESVTPQKNSLNVLNHGDCWLNNMLFRYSSETGQVEDVRFVDFQIARFASPVLDLQYFLVTSPTDEVRFQHRDTLLKEYHEELCESLRILNLECECVTLQKLKEEFEQKNMFALLTGCTVLCAVLAERADAPDLSEITEEDIKEGAENVMDKAYSGGRFRDVFQQLLVFYDKKGLL